MAGVNYGSSFHPSPLDPNEIGLTLKVPNRKDNNTTILRILGSIAVLGLSFLDAPLFVEVAFLEGEALFEQALDIKENHANVKNTLIYFGTPLLAGFATGISNIRKVGKFEEGISKAIEETQRLAEKGVRRITLGEQKYWRNQAFEALSNFEELSTFQKINYGMRYYKSNMPKLFAEDMKNISSYMISLANKQDGFINNWEGIVSSLAKMGFNEDEIKGIQAILFSTSLSDQAKLSAVLGYIREIPVETTRRNFKVFQQALKKGEVLLGDANQLPIAREFQSLMEKHFPNIVSSKTFKSTQEPSLFRKYLNVLKKPQSAEFNDYFVQPIQAVFDPNDLGRAPIEYTYRAFKKAFKNYINKSAKALKGFKSMEDAFVKTGGTLLDSDWLLGYKIIERSAFNNLVQLSFKNGKPPVWFYATDWQLERLVLDTGSYYLDTWAYSHGGKSTGLTSVFSIGGLKVISHKLTFLNIQALRNILSIVSNIVENVSDMVEGVYNKNYMAKLKSSFIRTGISRSLRLATRVGIGESLRLVMHQRIASFIGRQLQKFATAELAPIFKNLAEGKDWNYGINFQKRAIQTALTSVQSQLRKGASWDSAIKNKFSWQRKAGHIARIPNAVVPKRPWKGFRY